MPIVEAMLADVEERNQQLAEVYEDIDTLPGQRCRGTTMLI